MSVELPSEVVWFLDLIGVQWPAVDEDHVRGFAHHVRAFANNIDGTHRAASSTIRQMSSAYQGSSYEQLVATWARMSNDHMRALVDACHTVAIAVDVAADAIVAAKMAAIGELAAMAASFIADQAATVVTFGAAEVVIVEAAKNLVNELMNRLEQHILDEVIGKAVHPLEFPHTSAYTGGDLGLPAQLPQCLAIDRGDAQAFERFGAGRVGHFDPLGSVRFAQQVGGDA